MTSSPKLPKSGSGMSAGIEVGSRAVALVLVTVRVAFVVRAVHSPLGASRCGSALARRTGW